MAQARPIADSKKRVTGWRLTARLPDGSLFNREAAGAKSLERLVRDLLLETQALLLALKYRRAA